MIVYFCMMRVSFLVVFCLLFNATNASWPWQGWFLACLGAWSDELASAAMDKGLTASFLSVILI